MNSTNLYSMLTAFESSYPGFYSLITWFCYLASVVLFLQALFKFSELGHGRFTGGQAHSGEVIRASTVMLLVSGLFMALPSTIDTASASLFGSEVSPIDYVGSEQASGVLAPIIHLMNLIGYASFIRSLFVFVELGKKGQNQNVSLTRALVFMGAGVFGIHATAALKMLSNTFGVSVFGTWLQGL